MDRAYNPPPVWSLRFVAPLFLAALPCVAAPAAPPAWPPAVERLMAADAAFHAPPDLKRQLARHRDQLMAGVTGARESDGRAAEPKAHRLEAARRARDIAAAIRRRASFADVARSLGALVHDAAAGFPPPPGAGGEKALLSVARSSSFLGFSRDPFSSPESLARLPLSDTSARQAYDAAVTVSTRLLAWIWKEAGGDASIVRTYPEARGPYGVRAAQ